MDRRVQAQAQILGRAVGGFGQRGRIERIGVGGVVGRAPGEFLGVALENFFQFLEGFAGIGAQFVVRVGGGRGRCSRK